MSSIAVVGSLNIDYFCRVESFPQPGETVMASDLAIRFGGKGANQAIAAARLGAEVHMVGCLGGDEMGRHYRERLASEGIATSGISLVPGQASGSAFINLDPRAENTITVAPGANLAVTPDKILAAAAQIETADTILLQNEIPCEANLEAMRIASASDTRILYNPAPWDGTRFPLGEVGVNLLILNEGEACGLFGHAVKSSAELERLAPEHPCASGFVVTRGAEPTLAFIDGGRLEVDAFPIAPIDTVGAGDTFVGAFAVGLGRGLDAHGALRFANAAASLSTQQTGAQEAMPRGADVTRFVRSE